jgi:activator-of-BECN1-regulated-autophagy protein 1
MIRLEFAIISLSFHPSGQVLAIANGTWFHFWGLNQPNETTTTTMSTTSTSTNTTSANTTERRGMLTEVEQRHMLRCVHFPPNGNTVIVGGVNPNNTDHAKRPRRGGISGGGMSFYLRLWDFELETALKPGETTNMGL